MLRGLPSAFFLLGLAMNGCATTAPAEQPRARNEQPPAPSSSTPALEPEPAPALEPEPAPAPSLVPAPQLDPRDEKRPGAIWPPPGYKPPACELELSTVGVRRGKVHQITAYVRNVSKRAIGFELPDRCPSGPAIFYGLPGSYDYHATCAMGACAERKPRRFSVAAGQRIEIDAITIDPAGGSCNPPLPAGRHHVAFNIPYSGATCPGTSWAAVGEAPKPVPAPPLPKTAPDPGAKCPEMPSCGLACPGGAFARDANGCLLCGCEERRGAVPSSPPAQ